MPQLFSRRTPETIAAELDAPERIVLFCIASGTSLAKVTGNTVTARSRLVVRGLIERDGSRFVVTDQGRAVLAALVERE
jgi:hypothetical protein